MLLGNYHLSVRTGRLRLPSPAVRNVECLRTVSANGIGSFPLYVDCRETLFRAIFSRDRIPLLTAIRVLLSCICCFNQQRLSRVAEGTGPMKPQQPGASAKVLIPAQVGRDKILD